MIDSEGNIKVACFGFIEISDKEKEKLIHRMAYNCDPSDLPNIEDVLKQRRAKRIDIEITPRTRQGECKSLLFLQKYSTFGFMLSHLFNVVMREIEERKEFLDEMQRLGTSHVRKYEALINLEIANKTDELERIRYAQQPNNEGEDDDDLDMDHENSS